MKRRGPRTKWQRIIRETVLEILIGATIGLAFDAMLFIWLLSKCVDGAYKFETQANNSTAKSPMGAFDQMEIDNDIVEVMKALEDY